MVYSWSVCSEAAQPLVALLAAKGSVTSSSAVPCRLDPKGDGCISVENMLRRLGITFTPQYREDTPPDQPTTPPTPAVADGGSNLKQLNGTERYILKTLHGNWGAVERSLRELDQHDTGKVSQPQLNHVTVM